MMQGIPPLALGLGRNDNSTELIKSINNTKEIKNLAFKTKKRQPSRQSQFFFTKNALINLKAFCSNHLE